MEGGGGRAWAGQSPSPVFQLSASLPPDGLVIQVICLAGDGTALSVKNGCSLRMDAHRGLTERVGSAAQMLYTSYL